MPNRIQQEKDTWILYKSKYLFFTVRDAISKYKDMEDAHAKWKAKEITNDEYLMVARKYIYAPEKTGKPATDVRPARKL